MQVYSDEVEGVRREYRDPVEVFDDDSLASFRGMPVTIAHPPKTFVTAQNWKDYSVGHVGDDPRKADDGKHVAATLWIQDSRAIRRIQSKELQELSVGYTAALDEVSGVSPEGEHYDARQTQIRGNHVALLREGQARGGKSVRLRLDSAGDVVLGKSEDLMKFSIIVDGLSFDVEAADDNVLKALEKERADSEKILKAVEAEKSAAEAEAYVLKAELKAHKDRELSEKLDALKADALRLAPRLDVREGDTPEQIRKNALDEVGIKTDGKDDTYIAVRFDMALEDLENKKPARKTEQKIDTSSVAAFSLDDAARALN